MVAHRHCCFDAALQTALPLSPCAKNADQPTSGASDTHMFHISPGRTSKARRCKSNASLTISANYGNFLPHLSASKILTRDIVVAGQISTSFLYCRIFLACLQPVASLSDYSMRVALLFLNIMPSTCKVTGAETQSIPLQVCLFR